MDNYQLKIGWRVIFETDQPISRAEAWLDLIETANEFGVIDKSIRQLATSWRWPKSTVADFLCALKKEELLASRTNSGRIILVAPMSYVVPTGQISEKLPLPSSKPTNRIANNRLTNIGEPIEQLLCQEIKRAKKYRWSGAIIKLSNADYEKFASRYHAIEDFDVALATIDDLFVGEGVGKKWFVALLAKLDYRHRTALERNRSADTRQSSLAGLGKWKAI